MDPQFRWSIERDGANAWIRLDGEFDRGVTFFAYRPATRGGERGDCGLGATSS